LYKITVISEFHLAWFRRSITPELLSAAVTRLSLNHTSLCGLFISLPSPRPNADKLNPVITRELWSNKRKVELCCDLEFIASVIESLYDVSGTSRVGRMNINAPSINNTPMQSTKSGLLIL